MPRTKTLSADFYHSSSVFDQEIETVFKKEWLWVQDQMNYQSLVRFLRQTLLAIQLLYLEIIPIFLEHSIMSVGTVLLELSRQRAVSVSR